MQRFDALRFSGMLCTFIYVRAGVELNACTAVCRCASIEGHIHQAVEACYVLTGPQTWRLKNEET
jgi:hypothetical protein